MPVNNPAPAEVIQVQPAMSEAALHRARGIPQKGQQQPAVSEALFKAQERVKGLKTYEEQHPKDAASIVAEARGKRAQPLSSTELKHLKSVDPTLAKEAEQFGTYSEVMAEAIKTGKEPSAVATGQKIPNFEATRNAVVGRLVQLDIFQQMEGFKDLSSEQQKTFVESTFATNDRVRALYFQEMRAVSHDAMALPEDQQTKTNTETKQKTTERTAQRKSTINRMRARLGVDDTQLSDGQVEAMFAGGKTPEEARLEVMDAALRVKNIDPAQYHAQQEVRAAQARLAELQSQFQKAHNEGSLAGSTFNLELYLQGNAATNAVQEYKQLIQRNEQLSAIKTDSINGKDADIESVRRAVYGTVDLDAGGGRVGGVDAELRAIYQNMAQEVQAAPNQPLTPEQQQLQQQREQLRNTLQERMQESLNTAVETAWGEQIEEVRDIMERKQLAETAEKDKLEMTQKDNALVRLAEQQNHNWIGMDREKGNRTVNYEQIGTDVRYLAREGEEGVKRLMLRDMMMGGEGAIIRVNGADGSPLHMNTEGTLLNKDGTPHAITVQQRQPDGTYVNKSVPATWKNIPYDSLPEESRGLLNTLQQEQGNAYATRLIMDLEQARHPHSLKEGFKILGNLQTLNISRDEITALHTKLGDVLVNGIQKAKDADKILATLAAKGMNLTEHGGKSFGSLLLMLMMLLGLGGRKKED